MQRVELIVAAVFIAAFVVVLGLSVPGVVTPRSPEQRVEGGRPERGARLIADYGCGACHAVPGVPAAVGRVGPDLGRFGGQRYIAGRLPNTPENLVRWLTAPQQVEPGTAMPDLGVTTRDARDIAAYLYGLE